MEQQRNKSRAPAKAMRRINITMSSLGKGYSNVEQDNQSQDPAKQSVELAGNSARRAADFTEKRISSYSEKLKAERMVTHAQLQQTSTAKEVAKELHKKQVKKASAEARKAAESSKNTGKVAGKFAERASDAAKKALEKTTQFIAEHPAGCAIAALIFVLIITTVSVISSIAVLFTGPSDSMLAGCFTASEADIRAVEVEYAAKEQGLRNELSIVRNNYPGYDEYRFDLDGIGHDAWQLAAYLTVKYDDYDKRSTATELTSLFSSQYKLTIRRETETRYYRDKRIGQREVIDYDEHARPAGSHMEEYEYYVFFYYDYTKIIEHNGE